MAENERWFNIVMIADQGWKDRGQPEVHVVLPANNLQQVLDHASKCFPSHKDKGVVFIEEYEKPATKFGLTEYCGR